MIKKMEIRQLQRAKNTKHIYSKNMRVSTMDTPSKASDNIGSIRRGNNKLTKNNREKK